MNVQNQSPTSYLSFAKNRDQKDCNVAKLRGIKVRGTFFSKILDGYITTYGISMLCYPFLLH